MTHLYHVAAQKSKADTKLGGDVYKPSFSVPGQTDYVWRGHTQSLGEILKEDCLPLVVKLHHENVVKDDETPVDLQQPILLYKEVKSKKLHARNLKPRDGNRDVKIHYQTVGYFVSFPEQFQGYFRDLEVQDRPLQAVADLARYMPKCFVSKTACDGFISVSQIEGSPFNKASIPPSLYHTPSILEESITYINKRKHEKKKLVRCLRCKDENERTVLFPLEGKGQFYLGDLGHRNSGHSKVDPGSRVMKWTELNSDESEIEKRIRVKMVHGAQPKEQCQFTGLLEFDHVTEEHTVVGCTISPDTPRLFEMAVTAEPFFLVALNSGDFGNGSLQQKSLKFVKKEFDNYVQCAKVKRDYDIDDGDAELP